MQPRILLFLVMTLALGTLMVLLSTHWLIAWMGLEINSLAILAIMARPHTPRAIEAAIKYFFVQSAATAVLLLGAIINAWISGDWSIQHTLHPFPSTIITLALAFKVGLFPLHMWLPRVLQGVDLLTGLIISAWQKIAPIILLVSNYFSSHLMMIIMGLMSILFGGWGGLNQTQLRKLLAFSSIAHLGWMVLITPFSSTLAIMSLITYIVMTSSVFLSLKLTKSTDINTLATAWAKMPTMTFLLPLILLSLAGLPPLTGFMPKWLILYELAKNGIPLTSTMAALTSLLSMFFYLRLCHAAALTNPPNSTTGTPSWRLLAHHLNVILYIVTIFAISFLPLTPTLLALLFW